MSDPITYPDPADGDLPEDDPERWAGDDGTPHGDPEQEPQLNPEWGDEAALTE